MINLLECVPCKRRKQELQNQLIELKKKVKQKAIETNTTHIIWFDYEDKKLFHSVYENGRDYGQNFEIISKHI